MYSKKYLLGIIIFISIFTVSTQSNATGVLPDTTVLIISEENESSQMGIKNTDSEPLLLVTTIVDIPEDTGTTLVAFPAVTRIEANGRQIVRFVLDKSDKPLKVQHFKRVQFEGIPAINDADEKSAVKVTIRQEIPVIISPAGLKQDSEPWKHLKFNWVDGNIVCNNPSAYVIRLSQSVSFTPDLPATKLFPRTYILPGQSFTINIPTGVPENIKFVRIFPASPYGFDVPPFDAPLDR